MRIHDPISHDTPRGLVLLDGLLRTGFSLLAVVPVLFLLGMGLWIVAETMGICRWVNHETSMFTRPALSLFVGLTMLLSSGLAVRIAWRLFAPLYQDPRAHVPALRMLLVTFGPLWVLLVVASGVIGILEGRTWTGLASFPVAWLAHRGWRSLEAHWPYRGRASDPELSGSEKPA